MNNVGVCGRVATGAAVLIRLNEASVEQMNLLVNWRVDPSLEIRHRHRHEGDISLWRLKTVIWKLWYWCPNLALLFLSVEEESSWTRIVVEYHRITEL